MTTMRWYRTGGPGRGAPASRTSAKAWRWAGLVLALAAIAQPGCASLGIGNPCNPCGNPTGWRLRMPRLFNHNRAECCEPGAVPGVEYGAPGAVLTPAPAGVVPAPPSAIDQLEPAPSAAPPADSGSSTRSPGAAGRTSYETSRIDRSSPARGGNLAGGLASSAPSRRRTPRSLRAQPPANPLDNLPPLTLPAEPASSATTPPASVETSSLPPPAESLPAAAPASAPAAQGRASPAETSQLPASTTTPAAAATAVPGIVRFQGLEPKLAGGSLPTLAGLDWLAEKGYKTLVDLREPGPDQPAFIAEATKRGFRYLPLPISASTLDADHVNRFNTEVDQADARPLYFFDGEGNRAGALWYIRRLTVEKVKVDVKTAGQEAKDLGLSDQQYLVAASAYIDRLATDKTVPSPATAATAPQVPAAAQPPSASVPLPSPAPEPSPSQVPAASSASNDSSPESSADVPRDPTAWKPYAALLVSGLGLPLAYWGRWSVVSFGNYVLASLPAPGRLPRSLPASSDV